MYIYCTAYLLGNRYLKIIYFEQVLNIINLKLYKNLSCENITVQKTNYFVIWFHHEKGKVEICDNIEVTGFEQV
jgi:hypothetical protein